MGSTVLYSTDLRVLLTSYVFDLAIQRSRPMSLI